jgi:hypothetical protein
MPRTSIPKTFGVISIVAASLTLLTGLFTSCSGLVAGYSTGFEEQLSKDGLKRVKAVPEASAQKKKIETGIQQMILLMRVMGYHGLVFTVMSVFLLVLGIGQLRYRAWARRWTVAWSLIALSLLVGSTLVCILIVGPAYHHFMGLVGITGGQSPMEQAFMAASTPTDKYLGLTIALAAITLYGPYPVLQWIFFSQPKVKLAMTD